MNKVIILGGGPAGCAAAYYLKKAGVEDVSIVESGEIGGCCRTRFYKGIPFEFGPQIMYTDEVDLQEVFEIFLTQYYPPNKEKIYKPVVSIDGKLGQGSLGDFPVTFNNVLLDENPTKVIQELYELDLGNPDYSNFENYVKSRMGESLYNTFVKNYNIKQWGIHPKDMDCEWAKFRQMSVRSGEGGMFKNPWQGHPGDYNPLWEGLTEGVNVIKGRADVSEDFKKVFVNGEEVNADLIVSTLPLSDKLEFVGACLVYVVIKSKNTVMPSYATSFPNTYDFVRVMEYRQQFEVESDYTLLDFQFPIFGEFDKEPFEAQVREFVEKELGEEVHELWFESKKRIYPVSTKANLELVEEQLKLASKSKVVPLGRAGVHAYVSKDTCLRMSRIMVENMESLLSGEESEKYDVLMKMREKLT